MSRHTIVVEFSCGDPTYSARMELLGGQIVAVAFADELARIEALEAERNAALMQRDNIAQILRDLVPGCKWRIMRPRIDAALAEIDNADE